MRLSLLFSTIVAGFSVLPATQTAQGGEDRQMELLLNAIAAVESRHDSGAVGDNGRAVGIYQIHRSYWADGTRILGVTWDYRDARDPQKARQVVRAYLSHYGKGKTLLEMARIHNGGPAGHKKEATVTYARRIEQVLDSAA